MALANEMDSPPLYFTTSVTEQIGDARKKRRTELWPQDYWTVWEQDKFQTCGRKRSGVPLDPGIFDRNLERERRTSQTGSDANRKTCNTRFASHP